MQIRTRLTLQFTGLAMAILSAAFVMIYWSASAYRAASFQWRLKAKASTNIRLYFEVEEVDSAMLRLIDQNKRDALPRQNIAIYSPRNELAYLSNDSIALPGDLALIQRIRAAGELHWSEGDFELIGLPYHTNQGKFVVLAGALDVPGRNFLRTLGQILIAILASGGLFVLALGWLYAGRALRPINRIVDRMQDISATNLDARLAVGVENDEIGKLTQAFNLLLVRLERSFTLQRDFVSNVSHELRNPLTRITAQLEVALLKERSPEAYRETLASVLEDIRGLNVAASTLLDLARVNAADVTLSMMPVRIDEVIWHCREQLEARFPGYHAEVEMDLPDDASHLDVHGNEYLLQLAIMNLMENGCKFSHDHCVKVTLRLDNRNAVVTVADLGIGIAADELSEIFQPFFRGKNAEFGSGHGIGLSLVARIMELHGARIDVQSVQGKGTTFMLALPRSEKGMS